jgi:hypothetical protein
VAQVLVLPTITSMLPSGDPPPATSGSDATVTSVLHAQALTIQSIWSLIQVVLDPNSTSYYGVTTCCKPYYGMPLMTMSSLTSLSLVKQLGASLTSLSQSGSTTR